MSESEFKVIEPLKINKKSIAQIQSDYKWKGSGLKEDPIIIDSSSNSGLNLFIRSLDLHILIKDVNIFKIILNKCQNVKIENSEIYYFKLFASQKNLILNNKILGGYFSLSGENVIENNTFDEESREFLTSEQSNTLHNAYLNCLLIMGIVFSFTPFLFIYFGGGLLDLIFPFSIIIGIFYFYFRGIKLKKTINKLSPNVFKNNKFSNMDDLLEKYKGFRT